MIILQNNTIAIISLSYRQNHANAYEFRDTDSPEKRQWIQRIRPHRNWRERWRSVRCPWSLHPVPVEERRRASRSSLEKRFLNNSFEKHIYQHIWHIFCKKWVIIRISCFEIGSVHTQWKNITHVRCCPQCRGQTADSLLLYSPTRSCRRPERWIGQNYWTKCVNWILTGNTTPVGTAALPETIVLKLEVIMINSNSKFKFKYFIHQGMRTSRPMISKLKKKYLWVKSMNKIAHVAIKFPFCVISKLLYFRSAYNLQIFLHAKVA